MSQPVDQAAAIAEAVEKVLDQREAKAENIQLKARLAELEAQEGQHTSYAVVVSHAGSCPSCHAARVADKTAIIGQALNGITNRELVELAIERNAIPTRIEIPD